MTPHAKRAWNFCGNIGCCRDKSIAQERDKLEVIFTHNCWRACAKPRNSNNKPSHTRHTVCSVLLCVWQKKRSRETADMLVHNHRSKSCGSQEGDLWLWTETHGSLLCSWATVHVEVLMHLTFSPSPRVKDGRKADELWANLDQCQTIKAGMTSVAKVHSKGDSWGRGVQETRKDH